jgi:hypothetical protein
LSKNKVPVRQIGKPQIVSLVVIAYVIATPYFIKEWVPSLEKKNKKAMNN